MNSTDKPRVYRAAIGGWIVNGGGLDVKHFERWEVAIAYALNTPSRVSMYVPPFGWELGPFSVSATANGLVSLQGRADGMGGLLIYAEELFVLAAFATSASMYFTPELWK